MRRRSLTKKVWIPALLGAVLLTALWLADSRERSAPQAKAEESSHPATSSTPSVPLPNRTKAPEPAAPPTAVSVNRDERRHSELSESVLLQGRVRTENGDPAAFAEISLHLLEGEQALAVSSTDAAGLYRIEAEGGLTVRATVKRDGFAALEDYLDLPPQGVLTRDYVLRRAASSLRGRIVDDADRPVAGARVRIAFPTDAGPNSGARYLQRSAEADAEGVFRIENLPPMEIALTISARGFFEEVRHVRLREGREGSRRFRLRRGRLRFMTVSDAAGEPVEWARLDCGPLANYYSDAAGRIEFVLPNTDSSINCEVTASGHLSKWAPIDPQVQNTKVVLEEGPIFEGVILSETGQPVAGAEVVVSGRDHRFEAMLETLPDGRFSLTLAWPPATRISVEHPDFIERTVHLSAEEEASSIEIRLPRPEGAIFGRALQPDGSPMPRFTIFLSDGEHRFSRSFEDSEGRFEFNNLPAGSFTAVATTGIPEYLWLKAKVGPLEVRRGRRLGEVTIRFPEP